MPATKAKQKTATKAKNKTAAAKKAKSKPAAAGKASSAKKGARAVATKTKKVEAKKVEAPKKRGAKDMLDFAEFPAGSVTRHTTTLCLACIFRLFTKQLGLAPRTAYNEIRRYAPTVEELASRNPQRPFFKPSEEKNPHCPYCEAPKRWHARVTVHRIEGGKSSDAARRD